MAAAQGAHHTHTAGGNHLADTERRIARIALDNLRRYLAGEALRNRVR